jgi:hypothetical protein
MHGPCQARITLWKLVSGSAFARLFLRLTKAGVVFATPIFSPEFSNPQSLASRHIDTASRRGHSRFSVRAANEDLFSGRLKPKRNKNAVAERIKFLRTELTSDWNRKCYSDLEHHHAYQRTILAFRLGDLT